MPEDIEGSGAAMPEWQADLSSRWDTQFKRGILLLILVLVIFLLWLGRRMVPLMIVAGLLSYILNPVANFICRVRLPRGVMTMLLYLVLLTGVIWGGYAMIPVIDQQYQTMVQIVSNFLSSSLAQIEDIPDIITDYALPLDPVAVQQMLEPLIEGTSADILPALQQTLGQFGTAFPTSTDLFRGTLNFGLGVINTGLSILLSFLFVFVVSFYLTKDAPRIRAFLIGNFPSQYHSEWVSLIRCVGNVWHAFFWGQIILSLTIALMVYAALTILGVQGALILALLAGMLEVIPNLGPIISLIPALLVGLTNGSTSFPEMNHLVFALIIAATYFVMQQLENNIIVPRLIGHFINIHPILIILGVTVGYLSNGVIGAFVAAPIMGSARVLGTYVFAKLMDYPVSFPQTKSNLPLRKYDFSIQVHKEGLPPTAAERDQEKKAAPEAEPESEPLPTGDTLLDPPTH